MKRRVLCTIILLIGLLFSCTAKEFVVIIDPGHGGKDPGALGKNGVEKNINLNVAIKVGNLIKSNYDNVKVIYTRSTDKYVTLQDRPTIANRSNGDLYISIHTNASEATSAYGAETYTLGLSKSKANFEVAKRENSVLLLEDNSKETYKGFDPTSPESYIMFEFMQSKYIDQSVELASYIQNEFTSLHRLDRGVRQNIFWVLHQVKMPSILVELGFITNLKEEKFLLSSDGQDEMAKAIYNGFCKYKHEYDKRTINSIKQEPTEDKKTDSKTTDETLTKTAAKESESVQEQVKEVKKESAETNKSSKKEEPIKQDTLKQSPKNSQTDSQTKSDIIFKLQVFSSKIEVPKNNRDYRKLTQLHQTVSYFIENGWYKYTCGETSSYKEIQATRQVVQGAFPDSFIIAFKNGQRIPVQEAIKLSKQNTNK